MVKYRKVSSIWLKILCVPLLVTAFLGGTFLIIFKTIGVPGDGQRHVTKSELREELRNSSWCYKQHFDDGQPRLVCGVKQDEKELFYESGGKEYKLWAPKEYFAGWDEPPWGFKRYWKGKNIYFGYYPGATLIRSIIPIGAASIIWAGVATFVIFCLYPVLILSSFIVHMGLYLLKITRKT